eukprot:NODE_214_length_1891_cov_80.638889_g190_i0.p1 GENE.NODE_214_length_1891_cov_80.638889_g190_i0~~NODE_214_length_1891_cov_80.638889_g190_i0.p1  ORF type:complete len:519 (-),score=91.47 NODE_214_length_1891_cov_80.638889_g190_i0:186-1742(-)
MGNQVSLNTTAGSDSAQQEALAARRRHIVNEILATEETYVGSMLVVVELYILPLTAGPKPILSLIEMKKIFSLWQSILEFHRTSILPDIKQRVDKWSPNQCIGDVFNNHIPALKSYVTYVNNFDDVDALLKSLVKKNKNLEKFFQDVRKNPKHSQANLTAYLVMPIQRIPRYVMLLKDLLKHTSPSHKDYKNLTEAAAQIEDVAKYINEAKREDENSRVILEQLKKIEGRFREPLVQPSRRLITEGSIQIEKVEPKTNPESPTSVASGSSGVLSFFGFSKDNHPKHYFKSGFMIKPAGAVVKTWKKRFFILDCADLHYYLDEVKVNKGDSIPPARTSFNLRTARILSAEEMQQAKEDPEKIILVLPERQLHLKVENENERNEWRKILTEVLNDPNYQELQEKDQEPSLKFNKKSCYTFLFNDLILLCSSSLLAKNRYKLMVEHKITAKDLVTTVSPTQFLFTSDNYEFHFKASQKDCERFIACIEAGIETAVKNEQVRQEVNKKRDPSLWKSFSKLFS